MYAQFVLFLMALAPVAMPLEASVLDSVRLALFGEQQAKPPVIKVLVMHDKPAATLDVKGKYRIYDPNTNEHISTRFIGKRQQIQAISGGLKWG